LIFPGTYYPTGTTAAVAQRAALDRAPLRGTVRVIVVLVDFSDQALPASAANRFRDLFFSTGAPSRMAASESTTPISRAG
jgi:immune inhibitor A